MDAGQCGWWGWRGGVSARNQISQGIDEGIENTLSGALAILGTGAGYGGHHSIYESCCSIFCVVLQISANVQE